MTASINRSESGIYDGELEERTRGSLFPLGFLIVTLANLIEFSGRVDGEIGVVAVKIERDFLREGSEKEGEDVGLRCGEEVLRGWSREEELIGGGTRGGEM